MVSQYVININYRNNLLHIMKQSRQTLFIGKKKKKSLLTSTTIMQEQKSVQQQAQDQLIEISNQGIPQINHSYFQMNLLQDFDSTNSKQKKKGKETFFFSPKSAQQVKRSFIKQNMQIPKIKKINPRKRSFTRQIISQKCSRLLQNKQIKQSKIKSLPTSNKRLSTCRVVPAINMSQLINFTDSQTKERQYVISEEKAYRIKSQHKISEKSTILQKSQGLQQKKKQLFRKFTQNLNLKTQQQQNISSNHAEQYLQKGGIFSRLKQVFDSNKLRIVNLKFPINGSRFGFLHHDLK